MTWAAIIFGEILLYWFRAGQLIKITRRFDFGLQAICGNLQPLLAKSPAIRFARYPLKKTGAAHGPHTLFENIIIIQHVFYRTNLGWSNLRHTSPVM